MGEKIRRKALLILSCVLMLEAVGIRHVPNFQRVGLILYAAGMLAMYAMTLRRKIKGLAVNENDFMPFLFGAGLLAIEVRRYAFGEEGKLWLWIIIISLLLALPMLLAERRVPSGKAFSVSKSDYNRYDEQRVVTVTEHPGFWGAPYYEVELPKPQKEN